MDYVTNNAVEPVDKLKTGDIFTIAGIGATAKGDMIMRKRQDDPKLPFWGVNIRTGKRGKAVQLFKFVKL